MFTLANAVMITGKCPERFPMALVAVDCFLAQNYGNRRLIVINHGGRSLLPFCPDTSLIEEHMVARRPLGEMRNMGIDRADRGSLILTWDDDDWMNESYMTAMCGHYDGDDTVTLLHSEIKHDLQFNSSFISRMRNGHHGQVLYSADVTHRYPALEKAEDTEFLKGFKHRTVLTNPPILYLRTCHQNNTWDRRHIMGGLYGKKDVHAVSPKELELINRVRLLHEQKKELVK